MHFKIHAITLNNNFNNVRKIIHIIMYAFASKLMHNIIFVELSKKWVKLRTLKAINYNMLLEVIDYIYHVITAFFEIP